MKKIILISTLIMTIFSGCVSVSTGLKIAEFGVTAGFQVHDYISEKKKEVKNIVDNNNTK